MVNAPRRRTEIALHYRRGSILPRARSLAKPEAEAIMRFFANLLRFLFQVATNSVFDARLSVLLAHRGGGDVPAAHSLPHPLPEDPAAGVSGLDRLLVVPPGRSHPSLHPAVAGGAPSVRLSASPIASRARRVSPARRPAVSRREGGARANGASLDRPRLCVLLVDRAGG